MNIPWLTPFIGAIADGKVAEALRSQIELLVAQRNDVQAKVFSLQSEVQSLKAQLGDKTKQTDDLRTALNKINDSHKNDGPKIIYNTMD